MWFFYFYEAILCLPSISEADDVQENVLQWPCNIFEFKMTSRMEIVFPAKYVLVKFICQMIQVKSQVLSAKMKL